MSKELLPGRFKHLKELINQQDEPAICEILQVIKQDTDEDVFVTSKSARRYLSKLINANMKAAVTQFLKLYQHPFCLFINDKNGLPPLWHMLDQENIDADHIKLAGQLILRGKEYFSTGSFLWNMRNKENGCTILHLIADKDLKGLFHSLYECMDDPALLKCVNAIDYDGNTAIHYACKNASESKKSKNIALLINLGAKLNMECEGESAIEKIVKFPNFVLEELLLYLSPLRQNQFLKEFYNQLLLTGVRIDFHEGWQYINRFMCRRHYEKDIPLPPKSIIEDERLTIDIDTQNAIVREDNATLLNLMSAINVCMQKINALQRQNKAAKYFSYWTPIMLILLGAGYMYWMISEGNAADDLARKYDPHLEDKQSSSDWHKDYTAYENPENHELAKHYENVFVGFIIGGVLPGVVGIAIAVFFLVINYVLKWGDKIEANVPAEEFRELLDATNNILLVNLRQLKNSFIKAETHQALETNATDMTRKRAHSQAINLLTQLNNNVEKVRREVILQWMSFRLQAPKKKEPIPQLDVLSTNLDIDETNAEVYELKEILIGNLDKNALDLMEKQRADIVGRIGEALSPRR